MSKIIITILFLILFRISAECQSLTLPACVDYAVAHNLELTAESLNIEEAEVNLKAERHTFLPTAVATINNGLSGGFQQTFNETMSGEYSSEKSYTNSATLDVSVTLWNAGARRTLIKQRQLLKSAAEQSRLYREIEVKTNVIEKFFALAMAQKRLEIAVENCAMQDSNLIIAQKLFNLGHRSQRDVMDARTNLAQDIMQRANEENNVVINELQLRIAMNSNDSVAIEVAGVESDRDIPPFDDFYAKALEINPSVAMYKTQIEAAEYEKEYYKRLQYPSLTLNYEAGTQGQKFSHKQNTDFGKQWKDNSYQTIYLALKVPIFSQLSNKDNIAKSEIEINRRRNQLDQQLLALSGEMRNVWLGVVQSRNTADLAAQTAELARQQYEFAQKDFKLGNIASYELYVYKNKFVSSQLQAVSAEYEFLYRLAVLKLFTEQ
ncbi:MAG: TolC family protein [Bacteroidales bacterium]|nr:TolC family protein [Bacteroidales bacterium]